MTHSYFLHVWIPKYKCFFPDKIYHSKSYAKKKASQYGCLKFMIKKLNDYDKFSTDYVEVYRACFDEYDNQRPELGYFLDEKEIYHDKVCDEE